MANRPSTTDQKGIIAWFAANHVAANLLMIVIAAAALLLFCLIAFGAKRGQKDDEKLQEFDLGSMSGYSMQSVGSVQDVGSEYAVQIPMSYSGAMMNY